MNLIYKFIEKNRHISNNKNKYVKELSTKIYSNNNPKFSQHSKITIILIMVLFFLSLQYLSSKLMANSYFIKKNVKRFFIPNTHRIAFVFGTRPEAIKLFPLITQMKKNKQFICITINTGQHKEMIQNILDSNIKDNSIDFNLNLMEKNQSLAKLTSKIISELENIYNLIHPNAVVVQGDTTTGFSAAISAFYQKIPIFHVEAGLRTNNLFYPFPEEFNRVTIDDISSLYFAPTEWSANNLYKENKNSSNIFITGNTIVDSLKLTLNRTNPSNKIKDLIKKVKSLCKPSNNCKIILLTCHRRENHFKPIFNILNAIQQLLRKFSDIVVIFPFHLNPNVKQSIKEAIPNLVYNDIIKGKKIGIKNLQYLKRFIMIPPLNYVDLVHLEAACYFIMSDSGGIQEEVVSIGKPLLILRENTERPEAVKSGCAFLVGTSFNKIYHYSSLFLSNNLIYKNISKSQNIYGYGNSSIIISKIIENYFKGENGKSNSFTE